MSDMDIIILNAYESLDCLIEKYKNNKSGYDKAIDTNIALSEENQVLRDEIKRLEIENDSLATANDELQEKVYCTTEDFCNTMALIEELFDMESQMKNLETELRMTQKIAKTRLDVITHFDGGTYAESIYNIERG